MGDPAAAPKPLYERWRSFGCCNRSSSAGPSTPPLANRSLLSYLSPQTGPGLAIATVHTVGRSRSAGCGILKWCFSARAFAASAVFPAHAKPDVVVVTNNVSWARDECRTPGVRFIPTDPQLETIVHTWGEAQPWPGASGKRSRPPRPVTLMKWQLFALHDYRAVFYHECVSSEANSGPQHLATPC